MSDNKIIVFYILLVMLPQMLTTAMAFVLCRKPPKNIISAVKKSKRSLASEDAWDHINITAGKFMFIGGLICIVLSADFCILAVSLNWIINAPELSLLIPYGMFALLLVGTIFSCTVLSKKKAR